ncbi:MAG: sugar ABC transporter permease, partial [Clostridium sp.]|nr:sugar ABC transporter permease [Clostridium sp.]
SFGAFEVPYLLGPTTPKLLPVKAYIEYSSPDLTNRPYAMVINTILIVISTFLIVLYKKSLDIFKKRNLNNK